MKFTLEIELGNDAMRTANDVANALDRIADEVLFVGLTGRAIRDTNGNTVGKWEVTA